MIFKTSWFNKGIYTSTLRRFAWGSVLYAVLLFLICGMPILFIESPDMHWILNDERHRSLLLTDTYLLLPLVVSMIVPSVVALLSFRFIHSKKTAVFVHSLPVCRKSIFLSSILAAFTLMAAPILINGLVLALMSVVKYAMLFDVGACLIWAGLNLLAVFLMFSAATFASFLTGNTFAAVVLNGLFHVVGFAVAGSFTMIAEAFLYGFDGSNVLLERVAYWNFVDAIIDLFSIVDSMASVDWLRFAALLVFACVLYAAAYLLYRKRRLETAEDVAGYRCLNPIFKYFITFLTALGVFSIASQTLSTEPVFGISLVVIISAVVYFAIEMILQKSLKIWKSYKGYLAFLACFAVMGAFLCYTSVFGFETRVPSVDQVEAVGLYDYHRGVEETYVADPDVIAAAIDAHQAIVGEEYVYQVKNFVPDRTFDLRIRYMLKNGKAVFRYYPVSEEFFCNVMEKAYTSQEYKQKNLELFSADIGRIYSVELRNGQRLKEDEIEEFLLCLRADLRETRYAEVHNHEQWRSFVYVEYVPTSALEQEDGREIRSVHQPINASFVKTIAWLRAHGHFTSIVTGWGRDLVLLTAEQWEAYNTVETTEPIVVGDSYTQTVAAETSLKEAKKFSDIPGAKRITDEATRQRIYETMVTTVVPYEPNREYAYYLCWVDEQELVYLTAAFYDTPEISELYQTIQ